MTINETSVDSQSVGDPSRFLPLSDLERKLQELAHSPTDKGQVALVVRRGAGGRREIADRVEVSADAGVTGDAWGRRSQRDPQMQIAVMQADVAKLIANGQPLALFGDNLILDLDLSTSNLPPGTLLRVASALLQVTPFPHNRLQEIPGPIRAGRASVRVDEGVAASQFAWHLYAGRGARRYTARRFRGGLDPHARDPVAERLS